MHFSYSVSAFGLEQQGNALDMPWDNSVNKNAVIYATHTTLGVRNMPLTKQDCGINSANPFELNVINICIQNDVAF